MLRGVLSAVNSGIVEALGGVTSPIHHYLCVVDIFSILRLMILKCEPQNQFITTKLTSRLLLKAL